MKKSDPSKKGNSTQSGTPAEYADNPRTYLLRWDPAISKMKLERYRKITNECPDGFVMDWSIYDYNDAKEGDLFYMLREGEENGGIIFRGIFSSDPYEDDDWRGSGEKRHYIMIDCFSAVNADERPPLHLSMLEKRIPIINWRKGHSGELLTPAQAEALHSLWFDVYGFDDEYEKIEDNIEFDQEFEEDGDGEFDTEVGHGDHLSCFDEDIESIISDLESIVDKSIPISVSPEISLVTERPTTAELIYFSTQGKDVAMRTTMISHGESMEILAFVPYAINDKPTKSKLINIQEYSNGFEAVLTVEYGDTEFSFFDIDYALHKNSYKLGEYYDFALSAMAFEAGCVPDEEMSFTLSHDEAERLHLAGDDNKPVIMSMSELVGCLQTDSRYPDNAAFQSPVMSRARKAACLGREFYRMEICIAHETDECPELTIPLITRLSDFDKKPTMKNSIRGGLWLQGRLIQ